METLATFSGIWLALLLVASNTIEVPSRSARGWSLLPFVALSCLVAGASFSVVLAGVAASSVVTLALRVRRRVWWQAPVNGLSAAAMMAMYSVVSLIKPLMDTTPFGWVDMIGAMALLVGWFALDTALRMALRPDARRTPGYHGAVLVRDALVGGVVFSLALTAGALWAFSPVWAVAVALVPYLLFVALYTSFLRLRDIEGATVLALSRLPEAAGTITPGHSVATARLAIEMGKQAGLRGREADELEQAALLHDLGLVLSVAPSVQEEGFTQADVAHWTADLLGSSRTLHAVRSVVEDSAEPYRVPGADPDPRIDPRARMVAVACRTQQLLDRGYPLDECVEAMYEESKYRFDSRLVALVRPSMEGLGPTHV